MEIIAKKSKAYTGFAIMCFVAAAIGIFAYLIASFSGYSQNWNDNIPLFIIPLLIFPVVFIPIGIYCLKYTTLPEDLITLEGDKIVLFDGRKFLLSEVSDVSYKHSSSRYQIYSFGRVIFTLNSGETIKIYPVKELEETGKKLSRLIYGQR